jgi:hypothetical protein
MSAHICQTCGVSYPDAHAPPAECPICEDERQFLPASGQAWTTHSTLLDSHTIEWTEVSADLNALKVKPTLAIAQRAFLLKTSAGLILWDCLPILDDTTAERIEAMGGLSAIALSHPHYYGNMDAWAERFSAPIYVSSADAAWVQIPSPWLKFWHGDLERLADDALLIRCGGHFAGGTVLHWDNGKGVLLTGDIIQVVPDAKHVSFMRSYPNLIPLDESSVTAISAAVAPFEFDAIHGAFVGRTIEIDGKAALERSAARYIRAINTPPEN